MKKEASKNKRVYISDVDFIESIIEEHGGMLTSADAIRLCINAYKTMQNKINDAKDTAGKYDTAPGAKEKLRLFFDAVKTHNIKQGKGEDKKHIFIPSAFFASRETGINRTRTVAPFMKTIDDEMKEHYGFYGITEDVLTQDHMKEVDDKKRSLFIYEVLKAHGIDHLFNRK